MTASSGIMTGLLAKNGGPIAITKHWVSSFMTQMNFVKRHGNSKAKLIVTSFEKLKK